MRFVHVADLGLKNLPYGGINPTTGLNRRFEDVLLNFKTVITHAITNKVDYFIIAGDINEERNPESILIEKFADGIADLIASRINIIMVAGNHDVDSSRGTSSSISYLKALGLMNVYIADTKEDTFVFDNAVFHCIPTMYPGQLKLPDNVELSKYLTEYISNIKLHDDKPNILVTHYSTESIFKGLNIDEPIINEDILSRFDYVALGHIHKYLMFDNFVGGYTGSLFTKDFGETNQKFFNNVTFNGKNLEKINKVKIYDREFIQIDFDIRDYDATTAIDHIHKEIHPETIQNAIVKLRVKAHRRFNPKPIYDLLRKFAFYYTPIEWNIEREHVGQKLELSKTVTDLDIINQYMGETTHTSEFKNKVSTYMGKVVQEWEHDLETI